MSVKTGAGEVGDDRIVVAGVEGHLGLPPAGGERTDNVQCAVAVERSHLDAQDLGDLEELPPERLVERPSAHRRLEVEAKERNDGGDVAAVGVDKHDNVYAFNRGPHPMVVFDREGNFLRSWGEGIFKNPHGVYMGADDTIYLNDDGDHTMRRCTLDGKVLLTIGIPGKASAYMSGEPFNRCTHTAMSPQGDLYISDGYGNSVVHKYSPDGKHLMCWGTTGTDPGQFNIAHNIATDDDGYVYVADRENHRVQVFNGKGKYEAQWNNMHRPCALYCCGGKNPRFIIGELGPGMPVNTKHTNFLVCDESASGSICIHC